MKATSLVSKIRPWSQPRGWTVLAAMTLMVAGYLGAAGTATAVAAGQTGTTSAAGITWLVTRAALNDMAGSPAALATLAAGHVVELVPIDGQPLRPAGLSITPAFTVDSVTTLQSLITNHAVPSWARSVLFDDEAWSFTPINEQLFPAQAAAQAASLAHEASLSLWCTPALDLVPALDPTAPTNWQGYLSLDLAGQMGQACNGLDLQAQSLERNAQIYQEFVVQAAEQARAARPGLALTAGLSTNPPGATVSLSDLHAAVSATVAVTGGYWLNIPSPGPWCPTCAPANPTLAVSLLTWM